MGISPQINLMLILLVFLSSIAWARKASSSLVVFVMLLFYAVVFLSSNALKLPCNYVRKTQRGRYGPEVLTVNHVFQKYHTVRKTLCRHRDGKMSTPSKVVLCCFKPEFSFIFEEAFCLQIKTMEPLLFEVMVMGVRQLAYGLDEHLGWPHCFHPLKRPVGKD